MRDLLRRWLGIDTAEHLARQTLEQSSASWRRTSRDLGRLTRQVSMLTGVLHQQLDATTEALRRAGWQSEDDDFQQRQLQQTLALVEGTGDIIAGPWTGEVGFELLYWIPFLSWLHKQGLDSRRLIIVSRGGTAQWYSHLTSRYIDLLEVTTPEQLRARTTDTNAKRKQYKATRPVDQELLAAVKSRFNVRDAALIHPSAMFLLFGALWRKRATVGLVESFTAFQRLGDPAPPDPALRLPERYAAAKFYFSEAFPATDENRLFAADLLRRVSQQMPVVLLSTDVRIDDHADFNPGAASGLHVVDTYTVPQKNLELQTAIIRGARGFIGTYGGFSYLAPFYGVRSMSFFSRRSFESHHLELAHRVFDKLLPGGFVALDRRAIDSIEPAIGRW